MTELVLINISSMKVWVRRLRIWPRSNQRGDGAADLFDNFTVFILLSEKHTVHNRLDPIAQGIED